MPWYNWNIVESGIKHHKPTRYWFSDNICTFQRNELAADRAEKAELKEMLLNADNMYNELEVINRDSTPTNKQVNYKVCSLNIRAQFCD